MELLLMTSAPHTAAEVLPALGLLGHAVRIAVPDVRLLLDANPGEAILVDARHDLVGARAFARLLHSTGVTAPALGVFNAGGLVALSPDWQLADVLLETAGPAEVDARLRLAVARATSAVAAADPIVTAGDLSIDEDTYSARLRGRLLDLTYKEFELLKYLAQHPGRVFSRAQLLQEVWGYDYFGGTRTVDVHVRRLRAKLGSDHETLIGTVRNVGYKLDRDAAAVLSDQ